jgi:lipopolysaccharide assembly protein A
MRVIQAVVFLAFLAGVGLFALQNTTAITVHFLTWTFSQPVALFTVIAYLLGMLSGWSVVAFVTGSLRRVTQRPRN